jgi:hypothetical protein
MLAAASQLPVKTHFLVLPLFLLSALADCGAFPKYPTLTPVESAAKVIDGLEFTVITQSRWEPGNSVISWSVVLQLRVANRRKEPVFFPTFDSATPFLATADGKVVNLFGVRTVTTMTPAILMQPGQVFTLPFDVSIKCELQTKVISLARRDATGANGVWNLKPGEYAINMRLESYPESSIEVEPGEKKPAASLWMGEGTTESVHFKLAFPTVPDEGKPEAEPPGAGHQAAPPAGESSTKQSITR